MQSYRGIRVLGVIFQIFLLRPTLRIMAVVLETDKRPQKFLRSKQIELIVRIVISFDEHSEFVLQLLPRHLNVYLQPAQSVLTLDAVSAMTSVLTLSVSIQYRHDVDTAAHGATMALLILRIPLHAHTRAFDSLCTSSTQLAAASSKQNSLLLTST